MMAFSQRFSKRMTLAYVVAFVVLWHFFFASSFILRVNPKLFWPAVFILSLFSLIYKKNVLQGKEVKLFGFLFFGIVACFFSADPWTSVSNHIYYFIYLGVAAMIARNLTTQNVLRITLGFCIVHLVCIYVQVFNPSLYKSIILPLLPAYAHDDILYQMTYNASFYGFTVQTSMAAMYMTIGAICSAVIAKYESGRLKRVALIVLIGLFLTGVLFTTRRGSILAICLVLAYIYFDTSGSKLSKILLLVLGVAFLLSFGIEKIPGMQGLLDKFNRLSGNVMNGRNTIWTSALGNFWNHPIFGYGAGNAIIAGDGSLVDNAYLTVLVERGLVGIVLWFAPLISIFINSIVRKRKYAGYGNLPLDFSFYIQLLFIIMSCLENYFGQALTMFIYYLVVLCDDFARMRNDYETDEPCKKDD